VTSFAFSAISTATASLNIFTIHIKWFYDWEIEIEHDLTMPSEMQRCSMSWQTITISSFVDQVYKQ
jgi:hypothetical protein